MPDRNVVDKTEQFELLSAYLDNEVTAAERQQVELWLKEDSAFRMMHQRLRSTQQSWVEMPMAETVTPDNKYAAEVFAKIDQRRQRNWLKIGGGALAAAVLAVGGTLAAGWESFNSPVPQMATASLPTNAPVTPEFIPNPAPLMVALNKPIVEIAPVKTKSIDETEYDPLDLVEDEI
jgi:anti-sigma factor RsiW